MKYSLYVAGTGVFLPPAVSVESAIDAGNYTTADAIRTKQIGLTVADENQSSPAIALAAGSKALARSGYSPQDICLLLHAVVLDRGIDVWHLGTFLQHRLATDRCIASVIDSACNGVSVALELAGPFLAIHTDQPAALITAADRFRRPRFDRWRSDPGNPYGDGGGALVVSRERGIAEILSLCTVSAPELEGLHRGDEPLSSAEDAPSPPIDLGNRARAFMRTTPKQQVLRRRDDCLRAAVSQALADAGVELREVQHVVAPIMGAELFDRYYVDTLGLDKRRTTWEVGRRIGHLGAADQLVGLNHVLESDRTHPGDYILVIGVGAGFQWTATVLRRTDDQLPTAGS